MIKYLKDMNEDKKILIFQADGIPEVYVDMLKIKLGQYDKKTTFGYDMSSESGLITVMLENPEGVYNDEYREKEANKFMQWYETMINEVVIDDYK